MKRFVLSTRRVLAGAALLGVVVPQAGAQFVGIQNAPPAAHPAAVSPYAAAPQARQAPVYVAQRGATPYAPTANYAPTASYPTPAYNNAYPYPQVAQAAELPTPSESLVTEQPQPAYSAPVTPANATPAPTAPMALHEGSYATTSYTASHGVPVASSGCTTGDCGAPYAAPSAVEYGYGEGCYGGSTCDYAAAPVRPRRQWFGGLYGLYLDRAGDRAKSAVAYCQDTSGFTVGTDYYPSATNCYLFTSNAEQEGTAGAEIRFGSTFGYDPCGCAQPFAWEVGYWATDDDSSSAMMTLDDPVSSANPYRIYSLYQYQGLMADLDGSGMTWANRPIYLDDGMPADGDIYANDVRIMGVRVRQRFQAQNLELNFWRFGTPAAAPSVCGVAGNPCSSYGACSTGACGVDACGPAACAPCRPPRRFFINGLAGVRYFRVDDDFGLDQQFAVVDTTGANQGNVPVGGGWNNTYTGFPADDNQVIFSDYEVDNELVGFQLGCSMNWLIGCRWNVFADSNFGIYGNNAEVSKRVYGGGASVVTFANGGGPASVSNSETTVAYLGELRAGVGYQLSCNCRLTAAYRFLGIGGLALAAEEYQNTNWSNAAIASHIDANNSLILHGLQTGVEVKY